MPELLKQAGANPNKQPRYAALIIAQNFTGLYSNRSPIHDPSLAVESKFYGGRPDALLSGSNVELSNFLGIRRRPGLIDFSSAIYPTSVDSFYSFQLIDGTTQVVVDCGSTGNLAFDEVTEVSGVAYYFFTTPQSSAASNGFLGLTFLVSGFDLTANNGTFSCIASTNSYVILSNSLAVDETHTGSGISAGAVYYDQQTSGLKTLLFSKQPGAGQTTFQSAAGILYMGDGVTPTMYTPGVDNGNTGSFGIENVWNWNGPAPITAPSVQIIESGSAATSWVALTVFSTMGLLLDNVGHVQYLTSVNVSGTNTTSLGKTGNGQPAFNYAQGATTTDNTVTWTSWGPISLWTAGTTFTYEAAIFDPVTNWIFQSSGGKSGSAKPVFNPTQNTHTSDGTMIWAAIGPAQTWASNFQYNSWWEHAPCLACAPILPTATNLIPSPTQQTITLFTANDQTTGSNNTPGISGSGYSPAWPNSAGGVTLDGDLQWVDLGTATWSSLTDYFAFSVGSTSFSVVKDLYGDFQVSTTSGTSAATQPIGQWQAGHVYSAHSQIAVRFGAGTFMLFTTTAGGTSGSPTTGNPSGQPNWNFTTSSTTTDNSVTWICSGTTTSTGVWGNTYGSNTSDGSVVWVNVGPTLSWVANEQFYLQKGGFAPPTSSQPYGGASVVGGASVQLVTASGKSGTTQPTWPTSALSLTLTSVASSSNQTAIYTGTISGGGSNAFVGFLFNVTGFVTHTVNNGQFVCTASSGTTLTLANSLAVAESHAATATGVSVGSSINDGTVVWFTDSAYTQNSLAWQSGHNYAYSFYSRLANDGYNTSEASGGFGPPPGINSVLGIPTGSQSGNMTTASPVTTITGSNAGAVVNLSAPGPTDPQYDTIIVWRDPDGGGSGNMLNLTEFSAPAPIQGQAQTWHFQDFLPDTPTATEPGLNVLLPAPIDDQNDPPPSDFKPMCLNFQRIWGISASLQSVLFTGGPDVLSGNSFSAFNPIDSFPFLQAPTRVVKTSQGLITLLPNSTEIIAGGPTTASFYNVTLSENIGCVSFNAVDQIAGEIIVHCSDGRLQILNSSLAWDNVGFPVENIIGNDIDTSESYVSSHSVANDDGMYIAAPGSNGVGFWMRAWPRTPALTSMSISWSPQAFPVGGFGSIASIEISPGNKKLLVGPAAAGGNILMRDLKTFTDNGTSYDANFIFGSLVLASPGSLGICKFLEFDFTGSANLQPTVSYLLNEISATGTAVFTPFVNGSFGVPQFDPPSIYGVGTGPYGTPQSYSPNRYYFSSTGSLARARHLQIQVDFGTNSQPAEMTSFALFGRLQIEQ